MFRDFFADNLLQTLESICQCPLFSGTCLFQLNLAQTIQIIFHFQRDEEDPFATIYLVHAHILMHNKHLYLFGHRCAEPQIL